MSQSTNLSATDSTGASQPGLEASSDQGISLSDLSPTPPAVDETDETTSAPAKEPTEAHFLVQFRTWLPENKMAVSGWVVALLSLVVAVIAMVPGFRSESMSQRALELTEWTALKDFIENCKQDHQAGLTSIACQEAITQPLPPPPHVRITSSIIKRWMENGCNCKKKVISLSLFGTTDNRRASTVCIVLTTFYIAIHKIWYIIFPKCNCVKNIRSRVEDFVEQLSKTPYYEMIDCYAHELLDAQPTEARSKYRLGCIFRANLALSDLKKTLERMQDDTVAMDRTRISGLFGLLFGLLIVLLIR